MAEQGSNPFSIRTVAWLVVAGALAFIGFLLLAAYAPQMRQQFGSAAASNSAVGFQGLIALAKDVLGEVDEVDATDVAQDDGLLVVALQPDSDVAAVRALVAQRSGSDARRTLYILPKWRTIPTRERRNWVAQTGAVDPSELQPFVTAIGTDALKLSTTGSGQLYGKKGIALGDAPADSRVTRGPVVAEVALNGGAVLGRANASESSTDYILADPDIMSNQAMRTPATAQRALDLVAALRPYEDAPIYFATGVEAATARERNLLQLMFEPPFLALTLAVLVAAILAGVHAFARFGPAIPEARAIPFGKRALADTTARLVARGRAVSRLGDRYVALVRESAAVTLGAGTLSPSEQEAFLARLKRPGSGFAELAADAREARDANAMQAAAAALNQWKDALTRDRR